MSTNPVVRLFGHPGLRQMSASVNIDKITHSSIRQICNQLKDCMINYGTRSIAAPQIGYRYRIFAMETVFYEDFKEEKGDFEKLFLTNPKNEDELNAQTEGINAYLHQLEFHLNNHVPYKTDLENIENYLNVQSISNQNIEITPKIFINPTWTPLDLDQSIFEMEQNKGNITNKSEDGSTNLYTTLLFGLNGSRTSCNYEQCISYPELMVKKQRINRIRVEYYNENGNKQICYLKSHDARLFQHECDHLDGKLFTDNISWNDDNSIIYIDEYLRREQILKPQIESLISKFGPSQQDELYKMYDPLHPPTDDELIQILQYILDQKQQQLQQTIEHKD